MSEDIVRVVSSPRCNDHDLSKLSLDDFLTRSREYLQVFASRQSELHYLYNLFSKEELWPDQCEFIMVQLETVRKPILKFCALLDKSAHLPVSVIPLRYPLVVALYYNNEQIKSASGLIKAYSMICRTSSSAKVRQHQNILRKMSQIVRISEDILDLARNLIDQSQFEERRLTQPMPHLEPLLHVDITDESVQTDNSLADGNVTHFIFEQRKRSAFRKIP